MKHIMVALTVCVAMTVLSAKADERILRAYELKGPVEYAVHKVTSPDGKADFGQAVSFDSLGNVRYYWEDYDKRNDKFRPKRIISHGSDEIEIQYEMAGFKKLAGVKETLSQRFKFKDGLPVKVNYGDMTKNCSYDSKGNLEEAYGNVYVGNDSYEIIYGYEPLEFDSYGNWVKRKVTVLSNLDMVDKFIETRKIGYRSMKSNKAEATNKSAVKNNVSLLTFDEHPYGFMPSGTRTKAQVIAELKKAGWTYREFEDSKINYVEVMTTPQFEIPFRMSGHQITLMSSSNYRDTVRGNHWYRFSWEILESKSKWPKEEILNELKKISEMLKDSGYKLVDIYERILEDPTFIKQYNFRKGDTKIEISVWESKNENSNANDSYVMKCEIYHYTPL